MEANDVDLFWTGLLDCFYRYVKEKDAGAQVQRGVKAWMEMEKNGEWGSYVIRSSCVLETKTNNLPSSVPTASTSTTAWRP